MDRSVTGFRNAFRDVRERTTTSTGSTTSWRCGGRGGRAAVAALDVVARAAQGRLRLRRHVMDDVGCDRTRAGCRDRRPGGGGGERGGEGVSCRRIERQARPPATARLPKLAKCLGFSSHSVFTHKVHAYYSCHAGNRSTPLFLPEPHEQPRANEEVADNPVGPAYRGRRGRRLLRLAPIPRRRHPARVTPRRRRASPTPVPVSLTAVEKADFPVYLTGLGAVQAFNTVSYGHGSTARSTRSRSRKDRRSSQGDLLAEIDPRPFQAVLDQAKAKKTQDEANLANANLDLQRYTKLGEFATRQQTDTQRSTVAQLTAQIAADEAPSSTRRPSSITPREVADLRRRRAAPGRYRQHRQCRDANGHRHGDPDRADHRDLHRAGRAIARYQGGAGRRPRQDHRDHDRRQEGAG